MQLSLLRDFARLVGRMGGWVTAFAGISVSNYNPWARERGNRLKLEHIVQPVYAPLAILYFAVPFAPDGARLLSLFLSHDLPLFTRSGVATSLILVAVLSPILLSSCRISPLLASYSHPVSTRAACNSFTKLSSVSDWSKMNVA